MLYIRNILIKCTIDMDIRKVLNVEYISLTYYVVVTQALQSFQRHLVLIAKGILWNLKLHSRVEKGVRNMW